MTSDEYWERDPKLFKGFYEANRMRNNRDNEQAWLNGLYVYNAFGSALATAFGKKKVKYVEKPLDIYPKSKLETDAEQKRELEKIRKNLQAMYNAQQRRKNGNNT